MQLIPSNWHRHPGVRSGDQLALHDYETNVEADSVVKSVERLTQEIHERIVGGGG